MPYIPSRHPGPPILLKNGVIETIYSSLFRKVKAVPYQRERLELPDGDFIDLDWLKKGSNKLVILVHGLEGSSRRPYLMALADIFHQNGWDVLAWNARSCSGEMNRTFRLYSHADIDDLTLVMDRLINQGQWNSLCLLGVSMGGNMVLKYGGTKGLEIEHSILKSIISISTPLDLGATARNLDKPEKFIFNWKFSKNLKTKITAKAEQFPGRLDLSKFESIKTWEDFDNAFTIPLTPYEDAQEFYFAGSGLNFLNGIRIPTLILNAENDPILTPESLYIDLPENEDIIHFELSPFGGHAAFLVRYSSNTWAEMRSLSFADEYS